MKIRATPDALFAGLFEAVQSAHVFGDSKTFVDAVARSDPGAILERFRAARGDSEFDLIGFVEENFDLPAGDAAVEGGATDLPIQERISELWDLLTREADKTIDHSSLIPLPNRYVVPGGRFREVYYWDSYFTMLGLADAGRTDLIADMVENFAWLIDEVGFIPNGNRTYYCTRSQPPYFALMVELLADVSGDESVLERYLPEMKREYEFWMAGAETLTVDQHASRRVVMSPDGLLNRYWDNVAIPRQESYAEDVELVSASPWDPEQLYRDIRAGAESGWDYSSRWFEDGHSMQTIRTTQVLPVDLNALMYNLESTLADVCERVGDDGQRIFAERARNRRELIQNLFFDEESGTFMDLALPDFAVTGTQSIAMMYPLYFGIATEAQAERVVEVVQRDFLKAGGWVTSNHDTGHQWDSPNGWAPMQWTTYRGLERYGYVDEAREGARRWVDDNLAIYEKHGRLLEKYNVESPGKLGAGGEYEVQDGFGWTNAVLVRLMSRLGR